MAKKVVKKLKDLLKSAQGGKTKKPGFKFNPAGVKSSSDRYRNIKGVHYMTWTSDSIEQDRLKPLLKKQGIKFKIIDHDMFIPVDKLDKVLEL